MSNHANTSSRDSTDEGDGQISCVDRPVPKFVRVDGIDGSRWHSVETVDEGDYRAADEIDTECGLRVAWIDADEIVEADGEKPHFSGNTICYGCVRSNNGGVSNER